MKLTNKLTAAVVMLFIAIFSVLTLIGFTSRREQFKFSRESLMNGGFGEELNMAAAKSFAGRESWITASARINSGICESIVNGVFISEDRLMSAELSEFNADEAASGFNSFVKDYDGAMYLAAVPTSAGIYGDELPSYLHTSTEKQQIDDLYSRLSPDIKKIDAYSVLKMLSDNYIYYRSDEKWTSYGAYCVYRSVVQKLGFLPVSYDKYTIRHVSDDYRGNLYDQAQYMRCKPDLLDIYEYSGGAEVTECVGFDVNGLAHECSLYDETAVDSGRGYELYMGSRLPLVDITTNVSNDRSLLVIGDDYAACFVPFLTQHYSRITVIFPEHGVVSGSDRINTADYEQTLFIFGINSLKDGGAI